MVNNIIMEQPIETQRSPVDGFARTSRRGLFLSLATACFCQHLAGQAKVPARQNVPSLLLELGPRGFNPAAATVKAGKFLLIVHDQGGRKDAKFKVSAVSVGQSGQSAQNTAIKDLDQGKQRPQSVVLLDLTPGQYTINEVGQTKFECRLTVVA